MREIAARTSAVRFTVRKPAFWIEEVRRGAKERGRPTNGPGRESGDRACWYGVVSEGRVSGGATVVNGDDGVEAEDFVEDCVEVWEVVDSLWGNVVWGGRE